MSPTSLVNVASHDRWYLLAGDCRRCVRPTTRKVFLNRRLFFACQRPHPGQVALKVQVPSPCALSHRCCAPVRNDFHGGGSSHSDAREQDRGPVRGAGAQCGKEKAPGLTLRTGGLVTLPAGGGRGGRGMPSWLALNMGSAEAFATPAGSASTRDRHIGARPSTGVSWCVQPCSCGFTD